MAPSKRSARGENLLSSKPVQIVLGVALLAAIVTVSVLGVKKMTHSMKVRTNTTSDNHQAPKPPLAQVSKAAAPPPATEKEHAMGVDHIANAKPISPPAKAAPPAKPKDPVKRGVTMAAIKKASQTGLNLTQERAQIETTHAKKLGVQLDMFRSECGTLPAPKPTVSHLIGMSEAYADALTKSGAA